MNVTAGESPFLALGELVEARWRRVSYDEAALSTIARDALVELALHRQVDWRDLLRWSVNTSLLDTDNHRFGDVALRVFESARFYVEALFWQDGELAIHDHGFSGAFTVLSGSSLHVTHGFEPDAMLNAGFGVGTLALGSAERLAAGDVRTIEAGRRFVHAVYHMARPTVSLVVRSRVDLRAVPQLTYVAPGIAFDQSVFARDAYAKPLAALRFAAQVDPNLHRELAFAAVRERDVQLAFEVVMRSARGATFDAFGVNELCRAAVAAHPALDAVLAPAIDEQLRLLELIMLRRKTRQPEVQLLFALLMNVPERATMLQLLTGDTRAPADVVIDALHAASTESTLPRALEPAELTWLRRHLEASGAGACPFDKRLQSLLAPLVS